MHVSAQNPGWVERSWGLPIGHCPLIHPHANISCALFLALKAGEVSCVPWPWPIESQ